MIEPDISLDYDDIEDTSAEEAENGTSSRNFIQNSLMCSFCSSHFDNQEALLDHLRVGFRFIYSELFLIRNTAFLTYFATIYI